MLDGWKYVTVYCVTAVVVGGLVAHHDISPAYLVSLATWLIHSPLASPLLSKSQ